MAATNTGKTLQNFYEKNTKSFSVTITYNGSNPNIVNDTVSFMLKVNKSDTDANAKITKNADVTTYGASGKAVFELTPANTDIDPGYYYYEIKWVVAATGQEYTLEVAPIEILERVYDT